jgi:gluconokinase
MGEAVILAIDVGSSSARAGLYTETLAAVDCGPGSKRRYGWRTDETGAMEGDPRTLLGHVAEVIDVAVDRVRAGGYRVAAVVPTTFWHSLVGLDAGGAPVTPVYAWGDTRAAGAAERLREWVDPGEYHGRTGCFLHPSYPAVKLAWLREDLASFRRVASWVSFAEYLDLALLGVRRCSVSSASGTGLLDARTLGWDAAALEIAGIGEERLFPLVDLEPVHRVAGVAGARWPELAGAPWLPSIGDGGCANVGAGAIGGAHPGVTIGTSTAVRVVEEAVPGAPVPDGLWCYRLDGRRRVAGGALSNGGNALEFLRRLSPGATHETIDRAIEALPADGHGLTIVPSLVGERGLDWSEERSAAIVGLRLGTTPEEIAVALMEGIAYRVGSLLGRVEEAFRRAETVHASGGALHSYPGWVRILADATNRRVRLGLDREATSRGAAMMAAEALGWISGIGDVPLPAGIDTEPDAGRHARYAAGARRQREVARALKPWVAPAPDPAPGAERPERPEPRDRIVGPDRPD